MTVIQHIELGSAQASIDFTSIPQDGTDLVLVLSLRGTNTGETNNPVIRFNDVTTGYSGRYLFGYNPGNVQSGTRTIISGGGATASGATSNTFGSSQVYIPNYTSNANKSASTDAVSENNSDDAIRIIEAGLWANSAAITKVSVIPEVSANWAAGSSATLYKITKGSDGTTTVS